MYESDKTDPPPPAHQKADRAAWRERERERRTVPKEEAPARKRRKAEEAET